MLRQLFRTTPKWQSPKSQKRIEALGELDLSSEKDRGILLRLAREDSEPAVRREAVKRLTDLDVITQIQKRDLEAQVREAATLRLQDLISGRAASDLTQEQRLAGIRRLTTPSMLVHIVKEADHLDLKLAAIAQLGDEMFLDDIARHSTIARLRLAAAERITTPALLESLAAASKHSDKNVYKAIRARLDQGHQQEKDARALHERRLGLCEAMEHHARAAMNPLYTAKAESLRQQWQDARGAEDAALGERFETAFALAWRQISEVAAAAQREADIAQAREEMQQAVATLEATLAHWQGQDDFDLPALAATRKTQRLRWELAVQLLPAAPALAARYQGADEALARLEQMLVQWQQDSLLVEATLARLGLAGDEEQVGNRQALQDLLARYADVGLPLPALLTTARAALLPGAMPEATAPAATPAPGAGPREDAARQLRQRLQALDAALQAGHSRDAARLLRKAQDFARDHHLQEPRLGELAARVQELKSWAGFAVQPKKEALVERMLALAAHAMDPDDKADAIHALQEEWKALGVADPAIEQPLWERFKAAGDAAFAPCREHFQQQRDVRARHLQQRQALCRQLEEYLAALAPEPGAVDWARHEAILRTARQEWQRYHPSERQETRPLLERFNATLEALERRLREVQQQRESRKRELIARVRDLAAAPDLRAACDEAKRLQQEWKTIGAAQARVDRKLWQEFRGACDALFGRRDAAHKARLAERDAAVARAGELLEAYEALTGADPASRIAADELEAAFAALDLPREQAAPLRQRMQAARARLEQARRDAASSARREQQESTVAAWEGKAGAGATGDKAGQLLLDLEILLELPSPPAQQGARRARQLQRLQERGLRRGEDEARQLIAELLDTPPPRDDALPERAERLRQVLRKAGR